MGSTKEGSDEEHLAFLAEAQPGDDDALSSGRRGWKPLRHIRLIIECVMAIALVVLLVHPPSFSCRAEGRRSPVPEFPRKTYTFIPNKRYLDEHMFKDNLTTLHTLHNWIELSAAARGYVQIPDRTSYDLGNPYNVSITLREQGPAYMMTVFHQLHCLSYLVNHFQQGYGGVELTEEVAHHTTHCFDYLRQGIMCSADTSLEGLTDAGPGWGSKHECKDYDAVLEWANDHGAMPWRNELMPGESTL